MGKDPHAFFTFDFFMHETQATPVLASNAPAFNTLVQYIVDQVRYGGTTVRPSYPRATHVRACACMHGRGGRPMARSDPPACPPLAALPASSPKWGLRLCLPPLTHVLLHLILVRMSFPIL